MGLMELINMPEWFKWFEDFIPSMIGSAGSLLWMDGSATRKLFMFLIGCYSGYHTGLYFHQLTHVPLTLSWLSMGLFSVSLISYGYYSLANKSLFDFIPGLKKKFGGDK